MYVAGRKYRNQNLTSLRQRIRRMAEAANVRAVKTSGRLLTERDWRDIYLVSFLEIIVNKAIFLYAPTPEIPPGGCGVAGREGVRVGGWRGAHR